MRQGCSPSHVCSLVFLDLPCFHEKCNHVWFCQGCRNNSKAGKFDHDNINTIMAISLINNSGDHSSNICDGRRHESLPYRTTCEQYKNEAVHY
jgi:hypothetical protein